MEQILVKNKIHLKKISLEHFYSPNRSKQDIIGLLTKLYFFIKNKIYFFKIKSVVSKEDIFRICDSL